MKLKEVLGDEKVTFELFPGEGHGGNVFTSPENINKVLDFLDRYIK